MNKYILTALLALAATNTAQAWGPREQGIVAGVAGTLLLQQLGRTAQPRQEQEHVIHIPQGYVAAQLPQVVVTQPSVLANPRIDPRVYNPQMAGEPPVILIDPRPVYQGRCQMRGQVTAVYNRDGVIIGHRRCL